MLAMRALFLPLLLFHAAIFAAADEAVHCADSRGRIIGLAADEHYIMTTPSDAPLNEAWTKKTNNAPPCTNSFTGTYLQVLPDDRDTYHNINGPESFTMTGLGFRLRVVQPGVHTLFLRWTGGDTVGGGDSLYAVLYDNNAPTTRNIIPGLPTFKPVRRQTNPAPAADLHVCWSQASPCAGLFTHRRPRHRSVQRLAASRAAATTSPRTRAHASRRTPHSIRSRAHQTARERIGTLG